MIALIDEWQMTSDETIFIFNIWTQMTFSMATASQHTTIVFDLKSIIFFRPFLKLAICFHCFLCVRKFDTIKI